MKVFVAILVACLAVAVFAQTNPAADAGTGGAGSPMSSLLGGGTPVFGLAAMTGQLGDGMQRLMQCQLMQLPAILCMGMGM